MPTLFIQHKLFARLNLTPQVATLLLDRDNYAGELLKYPFIELLINENYPHLNEGKDNRDLLSLSQMYPLVLGNLGAGNSTMKAVLMVFSPASCWIKLYSATNHASLLRTVYSCDPCANFPMLQLHHRGGIDTPEIMAQITPLISMLSGMPVACRSCKSDNDVGSAITLLFAGV